ncbi:MAG TPA: RluA family pseudouridine synthase [Fibrobacteraceae bacterium]|nr:RluA family pseudouridine synthase [Fibrobacteraceae bacterium]
MIERIVGRHEGNQRLDRWLRKTFVYAPLSLLFSVLRKKKIRINGKPGKAQTFVQEGDVLHIYENLPLEQAPSLENRGWNSQVPAVDLDLVLRCDDFVIVNKPAGMPSQPGSGQALGSSLVEQLWIWARNESLDFKPALVHRLDQETSGLIVAALTGTAVRGLNARIRNHQVRKEYLALVSGHLKKSQGTIHLALERNDSAQGAKMQVGQGKEAITHYRVERQIGEHSLVRIRLETGRMHQIRTHFAHIGHPLLGDGRYGDFSLNRSWAKETGIQRLFLHSTLLEFEWNGEKILIEQELPEDLEGVTDGRNSLLS